MKKLFFLLLAVILFAGCTTFVRIDSDPSGAMVTVNGDTVGKTPAAVELSNFVFNKYEVMLKLEGHNEVYDILKKEAKIWPIVWSPFTGGVSLFWCAGPKKYYYYHLTED